MLTCKISKLAKKLLPFVVADIPQFVHGWTGIGKTEVISNELLYLLEQQLGPCVLHDFRMSQHDPVDASGIPVVDKNTMRTVWSCPGLVPQDDGRTHIIYYGEVGHLDPNRQHVLYQATQERALGGYKFPVKNRIILDLNTREDKGGDIRLLPPFENRGQHTFAELDQEGWIEHQKQRGCDPRVHTFIKLRPQYLHYMLNRDKDNRVIPPAGPAFYTPRSVERLDRLFKAKLPNDVIIDGARGNCGEAFARDFSTFLRDLAAGLPKLTEIKANPKTAKVPVDVDHQYVIASAISHNITSADADVWAIYLARLAEDVASMAAHNAMNRDDALRNNKSLKALTI